MRLALATLGKGSEEEGRRIGFVGFGHLQKTKHPGLRHE